MKTENLSLKIFNALAVVLTLIVNMAAVLLPLNGITTAAVSDKFKVFFVPANYVFSVWSVIYLGLMAFGVYQFVLKSANYNLIKKITPWFLLGSFANSVWLFTWHYGEFYWGLVLMLTLLITLLVIYTTVVGYKAKDNPKQSNLLIKLPFSIYLGWISVATIANVTDVLYLLKWDGFGIEAAIWSAIMITVATVLGVLMLIRHKDYAYSAVLVWAITGIAVKFPEVGPINIVALLSTIVLLTSAVGVFLSNRKK